jgi:hypothetical protein
MYVWIFVLILPLIVRADSQIILSQTSLDSSQIKQIEPSIETQYVESKNLTRVILVSMRVNLDESPVFNTVWINAALDYPGRQPSVPAFVTIGIDARPCHLNEQRFSQITFWGENLFIASGKLEPQLCAGGPMRESEFSTIKIPFDAFVRMANATEVVIQKDDIQFKLEEIHKRAFRRLIEKTLEEK